ncbi:flagellar export protein FliJ [Thorsellia kenyensis]|uniref:Flagellar FliJ protein n=1 Tax=Thorsellia kenyensis TaxID=1549888 RepID=A0ABV6CAK6_9GAMM
MAKQSKFKLLKNLADEELSQALENLGKARLNYAAGEKQLLDLIEYKEDYRTQLSQMLKSGITTNTWDNFERFIDSMDKAILQQRRVLVELDNKVKLAIENWQEKNKKVNSFDILVKREAILQQAKEQKIEQKLMDEYSARSPRRNL